MEYLRPVVFFYTMEVHEKGGPPAVWKPYDFDESKFIVFLVDEGGFPGKDYCWLIYLEILVDLYGCLIYHDIFICD